MKSISKQQQESNENAKICYICKESFENKYLKDQKNRKFINYCHYTGQCKLLYIAYVF